MNYYHLTYTDDMPEGTGGYAKYWFIYLRPKYKDDRGILEHEKCHVCSFYKTLGFHALFYLCSKAYRLHSEVAAYKEQLLWPPFEIGNKELFAKFIANDYGLNITQEEVLKLLTN
jgi:hypothetical protein